VPLAVAPDASYRRTLPALPEDAHREPVGAPRLPTLRQTTEPGTVDSDGGAGTGGTIHPVPPPPRTQRRPAVAGLGAGRRLERSRLVTTGRWDRCAIPVNRLPVAFVATGWCRYLTAPTTFRSLRFRCLARHYRSTCLRCYSTACRSRRRTCRCGLRHSTLRPVATVVLRFRLPLPERSPLNTHCSIPFRYVSWTGVLDLPTLPADGEPLRSCGRRLPVTFLRRATPLPQTPRAFPRWKNFPTHSGWAVTVTSDHTICTGLQTQGTPPLFTWATCTATRLPAVAAGTATPRAYHHLTVTFGTAIDRRAVDVPVTPALPERLRLPLPRVRYRYHRCRLIPTDVT